MLALRHTPMRTSVCTPRTVRAAAFRLPSALAFSLRHRPPPVRRAAGGGRVYAANTPQTLNAEEKAELVSGLLAAKEASGKSFTVIANELGLTNAFTANLFMNQARLTEALAPALQKAVPRLTNAQVAAMQRCPMRSFDTAILQEPNVYRTYEAIMHYGEAIKHIINEEAGDGIMSAIDFFLTVGTVEGKLGEKRVVITFNGKFLPHIEQKLENITAPFVQNGAENKK